LDLLARASTVSGQQRAANSQAATTSNPCCARSKHKQNPLIQAPLFKQDTFAFTTYPRRWQLSRLRLLASHKNEQKLRLSYLKPHLPIVVVPQATAKQYVIG
jgi:hypothetical protein